MFFLDKDLANFSNVVFKLIETKQEGNVFTITLNRPEKRNAFTPLMVAEIAFAAAYANKSDSVWCVLIDANGPVFCSGMDLNVFQTPSLDIINETLPKPLMEVTFGDVFKNLHKPKIAKVEGSVLAGGFLIICGCDFVISVREALFGLPEVKRGIFPMQVMASLLKIVSERKVIEMAVLARNYTAHEALEIGIVTQLSSIATIDFDIQTLIDEILENAPFAIKKGFEALQNFKTLDQGSQHIYLLKILQEIRSSEDAKEGFFSFKEKRKPNWKNG